MNINLNDTITDKQMSAQYNASEYGSRFQSDGVEHYKIGLYIYKRKDNNKWKVISTTGIKNICNTITVKPGGVI
ncbi:MAG: hypothetical protein ACI9QD_000891 [Thermoproteota archaeon]|jgi:hypothetical protein|tara:strand:- start:86 stop:307 length:222 start_codon:yes stop_codon:yes gene_type:complete